MTALRECPFCGGQPALVTSQRRHDFDSAVECENCNTFISSSAWDGSYRDPVAAWNKRADDRYTITPLGAAMLEGKK